MYVYRNPENTKGKLSLYEAEVSRFISRSISSITAKLIAEGCDLNSEGNMIADEDLQAVLKTESGAEAKSILFSLCKKAYDNNLYEIQEEERVHLRRIARYMSGDYPVTECFHYDRLNLLIEAFCQEHCQADREESTRLFTNLKSLVDSDLSMGTEFILRASA